MNLPGTASLRGWLPADVIAREEGLRGLRVSWTLRGNEPLPAISYERILQAQMEKPFHQLFRRETSLEAMAAWVAELPPAPLRGIVFHTSNAGAQELAEHFAGRGTNRVLIQPTPLDTLVRTGAQRETLVPWLRALVGALGQPQGEEDALILLLHPWHIHSIDLFRDAFPETPWTFLYDEPGAWLASTLRQPPMWTVPSLLPPEALRLAWNDWQPGRTDIYASRALAAMYRSALEALRRDPHGLTIRRSAGPGGVFQSAAEHFHLEAEMPEDLQSGEHNQPESAPEDVQQPGQVGAELQSLFEELEALRR